MGQLWRFHEYLLAQSDEIANILEHARGSTNLYGIQRQKNGITCSEFNVQRV